jgi:hypothetical protein
MLSKLRKSYLKTDFLFRSQQRIGGVHHDRHESSKASDRLYYNETPSYVNAPSHSKKTSAKDRLSSNFGRNSPSSNIVYHYDYLTDGKNIYGRPLASGAVLKNGKELKKPEVRKSLFSKEKESSQLSGGNYEKSSGRKSSKGRDVYEFEKKVPMHSSSLEAQKFKTIIFLSGH